MAMKVTITKAEYEALMDEDRAAYGPIEGGARYRLTEAQSLVDALTGKLDEFRDNNRGLNTQLRQLSDRMESLKPIAELLGDKRPEEIVSALDRLKALETQGVTKPDDVAAKIEGALAPLRHELGSLRSTITAKETQLQAAALDAALTNAARSGGVEDSMFDDFVSAARQQGAVMKDGVVYFVDGQGVRRSASDGSLMTLDSFVSDLRERKPRYFKASDGFDLSGRPSQGSQPQTVRTVARKDAHKYFAEIAAGRVVVGD